MYDLVWNLVMGFGTNEISNYRRDQHCRIDGATIGELSLAWIP